MLYQLRNKNFCIIFALDVFLFAISLFGAYLIRFDFNLSSPLLRQANAILPVFIPVKSSVFFLFRAYKGMFRYAGIDDMRRLFLATCFSSTLLFTGFLIVNRFQGYSRGVFVLDFFLTLVLVGGFRIALRLTFEEYAKKRQIHEYGGEERFEKRKKKLLIIGAGNTGEKILREIQNNHLLNYQVVGFLDDDPGKHKRAIHGVSVLGSSADLPSIVERYWVKDVLIAVPSATGAQMRKIIEICDKVGVKYQTVPGLAELIDGKVSVKNLRDVNYRDLLRREPVELDVGGIERYLKNKCVMVTGAGGSIGSELCRQIVRFMPDLLVLFDSSEPNLYSIQMELKHRVGYQRYATVLASVQDSPLVAKVMKRYRPDVIFHAAAYKHVPMLERNPWQAVTNNVKAGQVLMQSALENGVGHFVLVSTDKAVRPTNVMGASKRICELLLAAHMGNGTRMMAVRFGNVVNSAGSVVPLFREQIAKGGPVTVTHPEITRFFMTIPEAAQLILQAGALGKGGEMFILDMGTPIKIVDMARDLIRLSGKEPETEIEIVFTGLRDGEKLYEELMDSGEGVVGTSHEKIMVLKAKDAWNGHENQENYKEHLTEKLEQLYVLAADCDGCAIREKMKEIVPEYQAGKSACIL